MHELGHSALNLHLGKILGATATHYILRTLLGNLHLKPRHVKTKNFLGYGNRWSYHEGCRSGVRDALHEP
jgi:hypothetical protein